MAKKKVQAVVELGPASFEDSTFFNDGQNSDVKIVGVSTLDDTSDSAHPERLFEMAANESLDYGAGLFRLGATPSLMPSDLLATVRATNVALNKTVSRQVAVARLEDPGWQDPGFFFTAHVRLKKYSTGWRVHVAAVQFYKDAANADAYVVVEGESATFYF